GGQGPGGPGSRAGLRPCPGAVSAGGRDAAALPGPVWAVAILPDARGAPDSAGTGGAVLQPGPAGTRPDAPPRSPFCLRGELTLAGRNRRGSHPPGAKYRPL